LPVGGWAVGGWVVDSKKMQLPKSSRQKESENEEQVDVAERLRCLFALIANGIFSRGTGMGMRMWKWRTYTLQADQPHHHHLEKGGWLINCRKIFDLFYFWSPQAHPANSACCGQQYASAAPLPPLLPLFLPPFPFPFPIAAPGKHL